MPKFVKTVKASPILEKLKFDIDESEQAKNGNALNCMDKKVFGIGRLFTTRTWKIVAPELGISREDLHFNSFMDIPIPNVGKITKIVARFSRSEVPRPIFKTFY